MSVPVSRHETLFLRCFCCRFFFAFLFSSSRFVFRLVRSIQMARQVWLMLSTSLLENRVQFSLNRMCVRVRVSSGVRAHCTNHK